MLIMEDMVLELLLILVMVPAMLDGLFMDIHHTVMARGLLDQSHME